MSDMNWITRAELGADLVRLGIAAGDIIMVHAACSRVGPMLGGPDMIVAALRDAVGPAGTIIAYLDWDAPWEDLVDEDGLTLAAWQAHVRPFDPAATRAARDNGVLPEFIRTTPGALRSGNPGASMAAIGARAGRLTADHPLDYGYGPGTPLARLVEGGGKVLMLGAPRDTMTLMHHAEHLARLPDKHVVRKHVPFAAADGIAWRWIEEYDTADPVVEALPDNFIERIVTDYLATGAGLQGKVGEAESILVEAPAMLRFGIDWLERVAG
jgi:aminoglycoside 3-N-acetyltransferase